MLLLLLLLMCADVAHCAMTNDRLWKTTVNSRSMIIHTMLWWLVLVVLVCALLLVLPRKASALRVSPSCSQRVLTPLLLRYTSFSHVHVQIYTLQILFVCVCEL
jgi:hypothetical protein